MKNRFFAINCQKASDQLHNSQSGSIIVIVLMVLVLMSIIGIASTNTTVNESYIVRNTAIRKQNLHMADAAIAELVQVVIDAGLVDNPDGLDMNDIRDPTVLPWVNDKDVWVSSGNRDAWYDPDTVGQILDTTNSAVPESIINGDITVVNDRGEWDGDPDHSPIRYGLIGWTSVGGYNLDLTSSQPYRMASTALTEYVSDTYGVIRLAVGVERDFMF